MKLKKLLKKDDVEGAVKSKELTEQLQLQLEEHKKVEQRLLHAAQQWRTIFDAISDMVCFLDPEGRILRCNKAMANFFRKPFAEIINHTYLEIIQCGTLSIEECPFRRMKETRQRETVISQMHGRWFNVAVDPILDEKGSLLGAVQTMSDITERKLGEEKIKRNYDIQTITNSLLRLSLEKISLEETLSHALDLILSIPWLAFESRGNIFLVENDPEILVMKAQNGLSEPIQKECTKVPFGKCLCGQAALKQKIQFSNCLDDRHEILYEGITPHGHYCVPILFSGKTLGILNLYVKGGHLHNQEEEEFLIAISNALAGIILRKRAEEERNALQEQLRQSQKMETIGQLAGGVAHDFNNLLTVIRGYTDLLLKSIDPNNPLYPDTIEIRNASEKAESLTRQLLVFSRKQALQSKVLDLNTLVSNLDKMLQRLIGEDIQLVTVLAEGLGKIKADPGQIEQMIINLAVNARDAMLDGGKLTVETANVKLDEHYHTHIIMTPGPYVMLSISDSGIGMTQEIKERIFEPFFTTKGEGKGTGLGLSTVYGIVKQSGGNILVYSKPGHGTTFKIYLPRVDEDLESLGPTEVSTESLEGSETILLVEDEEVVRRVVVAILQNRGYTVLEAMNGEEALRLVQEHNGNPIDLVVTDVVMPKMSGLRLAKYLLALCHEIKVLYMSGYTDNALIHQEILKPQIPFIQKPFTSEGLARKVREVLDGHS